MAVLKNFRVKSDFVALPKPTFDCGVVGFDVFKQPVPVDLVAEAEHPQLDSLMHDITGSSFPLQLQKYRSILVVLLGCTVCEGTSDMT